MALATSATPTVNKFAKKMCKNDYKSDKHSAPKFTTTFSNVTVGVVGYFLGFVGRLRVKSSENVILDPTLVLFFHF